MNARELCLSVGIRNLNVAEEKKETEEKIGKLREKLASLEAYLSKLNASADQDYLDRAVAMAETLADCGLDEAAIGAALAKQFAEAIPQGTTTSKTAVEPGTKQLDEAGKGKVLELLESATEGFQIAEVCRQMLPYVQSQVRSFINSLRDSNEVVNRGSDKGKGARWFTATNDPGE